ncbi:phosphoadenosine phosphosulfate reductase family protein [Methylobacterium sp. J-078]|uniref:phosphoadenosine phosphosulfate reductase family protein n=1 Tax=Methylobacterium sp. J-078 TaxID=2836657 RepID=UPI001FBB9807|nr:phosphoadenosine phosphosulfate reductase family protein [Methylobacterium sp. J-078]MCJ2043772.1 phosphoadenosine phosphosulfate reductase family protein [Methylobacterium sp. J-078]
MTAALPDLVAASRAAIADLFARHDRVFLAFSGGKDSMTILHLCEPYRDRLTLVWVNTGLSGDRMTAFVRSFGDRFDLIELAPERPVEEQWREHGIPAVVLPLDHIEGVDFRSPRLQPWLSCCGANRVRPLHALLEAQAGPCAVLNGQRQQDQGGTPAGLSGVLPATVEVSLPIWDWTDADVLAFVEQEGIPMHPHFAVSPSSPECLRCPAIGSREKMNLLDRHYPADAVFVRQAGRYALGLAAARAMELDAILAEPTTQSRA